MVNIVFIISFIDKALAYEWIADNIDKSKFKVSFILLNPKKTFFETWLVDHNIKVYPIFYASKKNIPIATFQIYQLLKKINPDIVHCNHIDASLTGLFAASLLGIKTRIHTRHHSIQHHHFHPKGVWLDRLINILSTNIISPCDNISHILIEKEKVDQNKISIINHGFELSIFSKSYSKDEINDLKNKHKIPLNKKYIGVISRLIELKGVQFIIPAFELFLRQHPDSHLIIANANGDYKNQILKLLSNIDPENYTLIEFEHNISALYQVFDFFIHVPYDQYSEAFGQTYIESLASGIPSIFTLSGIANDFIIDHENAIVVDYKNSDQIEKALISINDNPKLRSKLIENGRKSIQRFELKYMIEKLESIYLNSKIV